MLWIENLQVSYQGNAVLRNLSVQFREGGIYGLAGLNGAGKTTFLNVLYGLKRKESGCITWKGGKLMRKDIAYLEAENYFYSHMTGMEYLSLFPDPADYDLQRWNDLFRLPLKSLIETYSTGMKRKLALMGVLKQNRPLLMLDEPFNGLDLESVRFLSLILLRLREKGHTILLTSHILESLTNISDYIYFLKEGQIAWSRGNTEFEGLETEIFKDMEADCKKKMEGLFL